MNRQNEYGNVSYDTDINIYEKSHKVMDLRKSKHKGMWDNAK